MQYLAAVNRLRMECAAGGAMLTTLQSGLSAESMRFKTWLNEAYRDIQQHKPDWQWMRKNFAFDTTIGQQAYTLAQAGTTDLGDWKRDSVRAYNKSVGTLDEQILPFMEWDTFRNVYQYGSMRTASGRPTVFTIAPDKSCAIGSLPDAVYTVTGEYYRAPADLVNDTDDMSLSGLPERYHMLAVYLAMQSYASFYAAPEVMQRGSDMAKKMLRRLEFEFLPTLVSGPPLA